MAPGIVYENVTEDAELEAGSLFKGKQFWIALRVPGRKELEAVVIANGGSVVKLEKQADYMIADHFRPKHCPPGSISYTFVRESVAKGELQDPDDHPAGPRVGTAREVGSSSRPAKSTRTPYTQEEDRILYKWAKTAEQSGLQVRGNELYKQLEAQYPQHTFQSWRDRYLKKLQYMPASAFNMSDSAPLSPIKAVENFASKANKPCAEQGTGLVKNKDKAAAAVKTGPVSTGSSASKEHTTSQPAVRNTGLVKNKDNTRAAATSEQPGSTQTGNNKNQTNAGIVLSKKQDAGEGEYTLKQLEAMFSAEDWESLYAFVKEIEDCSKEDGEYAKGWAKWAEDQGKQTAEQWRQYYEKVVRPQWLKDPESKRERIRKKVQERPDDAGSDETQSQNSSQTQEQAESASPTQTVPSPKAPKHVAANVLPSDSGLASESTAQQESPKYLRDGYESALKRIRGEVDGAAESKETWRPAKIARKISRSPTPVQPEDVVGTQEQPLEISSVANSPSPESTPEAAIDTALEEAEDEEVEDEEAESEAPEGEVDLYAPIPRPNVPVGDDEDLKSNASSTDFVHTTPLPRPARIPEIEDEDVEEEEDDKEDSDEDSLPSNSRTPRAIKHNAFDTQAILSPSQNRPQISALPRPRLDSSPPHRSDSDASVTQSLQEFSSYLQDDPPLAPAPARPASPTPSSASSASTIASDTDPDPPLTHDELPLFVAQCTDAGFDDAAVRLALRRTRGRPTLAETVLEAWREGLPLPVQRGIWSKEEDAVLESGDGRALQALATRHSLDGWGGVTERMNFLRAWREGD
ncbi:hypothetical protein G6514_007790 [Epicoccum nigrum]|nr:hypothetical protein G6514_007790 [Epicoccum nigrum]